jgi:acetyl-CoA/propionyl-CoA carboxylase biotin carboxyl carrier protein
VTVGEQVRSGQKLLVLEAMKLENSITAIMDGTVTEILVSEGDVVAQGQTLVVLS